MAITVGALINICRRKILDEEDLDFSDAELLQLYNNTNKKIVTLRPQAYTRIESMLLSAGNKQLIPSDGLTLISVRRNMGTDGATPGRAIRMSEGDVYTTLVPTWATDTAAEVIEDFWPVPNYPEQFYVYPPSDGSGYIELEYAKVPPVTIDDGGGAWESEQSPFNDSYIDAQINGILYTAYDDDTDIPGNTPRSALYYARFLQALGISTGGQQ